MAYTSNSYDKDNKYTSKECDEFIEKYCIERDITSQELAMDADHFDIVLNLFDEFLKNK